jgi:hypothetical protein
MSRQHNESKQYFLVYAVASYPYVLQTVLIYLPAHNEMQYSRHRLAWLEAATGGGLGADSDRIILVGRCQSVRERDGASVGRMKSLMLTMFRGVDVFMSDRVHVVPGWDDVKQASLGLRGRAPELQCSWDDHPLHDARDETSIENKRRCALQHRAQWVL